MDEERPAGDIRFEHCPDQHAGQRWPRRDDHRVLLRVHPSGVDGGGPAGRRGAHRGSGGLLCRQHPQRVRDVPLHPPLLRCVCLPFPLLSHTSVCLRGPAGHGGRISL